MTHLELTYYRLYPDARRITVKDWLTGTYEYLVKNSKDARELIAHLANTHGSHGTITETILKEEV